LIFLWKIIRIIFSNPSSCISIKIIICWGYRSQWTVWKKNIPNILGILQAVRIIISSIKLNAIIVIGILQNITFITLSILISFNSLSVKQRRINHKRLKSRRWQFTFIFGIYLKRWLCESRCFFIRCFWSLFCFFHKIIQILYAIWVILGIHIRVVESWKLAASVTRQNT